MHKNERTRRLWRVLCEPRTNGERTEAATEFYTLWRLDLLHSVGPISSPHLTLDEADELRQAVVNIVLSRTIENPLRFCPPDRLNWDRYLKTGTKWVLRSELRKIAHRNEGRVYEDDTSQAVETAEDTWPSGELSVEDQVQEAETLRRLEKCLAALPSRTQIAILLVDYQGYSYREVVQILDRPVDDAAERRAMIALDGLLRRGREKVRRCMENDGNA